MSTRPFRFGVSMTATGSHEAWQAKARQAEELGYDVLHIPDHLGMAAPFPALVSAADATTTLRVGTLVLNSGFYRPALLARDIADTDQLTDGRLEVGLGAGCVGAEFHAAELAYPTAEERVDNLAHTVAELHRMFAMPEQQPAVRQRPGPPLLLAGLGDRILRLAAREADIVGLPIMARRTPPGLDPQQVLADRVDHVRSEAGARFGRLELNLFVSAVVLDEANSGLDALDLTAVHRTAPNLTRDQILRLPNVLAGSVEQIAETLNGYRDTYRVTYFSVLEPHMADFAKVIAQLR
ncbi:LLM class F420-dependent oxidoreductase [Streptomyces camponoticapitis]|uniref:LLM class F420-dependent oxidoreductase n=1 Tax=Streptomyces camponoticapitis TaxID=1616125 RepID=A0ABQ2E0D1_9ACTN|nr:TIGR03621 family F420-dependent LLM class oxidoreductase [Streptomyces camponoticapitis]GGJ83394.1 LLM class F420-dependent oxidoreductase [Streptomyces camponoticapitis]